jgi:hypothetical protein
MDYDGIATPSLLRLISGLSPDVIGPGAFTNILCLCVIDQAIIMGLGLCVTVTRLIGFGPVLEFRS